MNEELIARLTAILQDMDSPNNYYVYKDPGPYQMIQSDKWKEWQSRLMMILNELKHQTKNNERG